MDKTFDKQLSKRVKGLLEQWGFKNNTLALILKISLKSTNDLMTGVSPWRIPHIKNLVEYFGVTSDFLIFGDDNYVDKYNLEKKKELVRTIKTDLVSEGKYQVYGKLDAEGFFKILDK